MDDLLEGFDRLIGDTYPYLAEMLHEHVQQPGYDFAHEFEIGLDVVLDGIGRLRTAGRR